MHRSLLGLASLGAALALSACAPSSTGVRSEQAPAAGECLFTDRIENFRQGEDGRTLYLKTRRDQVFEVRSTGYCPDLDTTIALAVQPEAGMSRVCTGDWAGILVSGGQVCRVQVVRKLTADQLAALPSRSRP